MLTMLEAIRKNYKWCGCMQNETETQTGKPMCGEAEQTHETVSS